MIRVAIDINHVIRDINKQILKYYQKDIDHSLDIDEIDTKDNVFDHVKFVSDKAKNEFIYTDYPYEIFGCAKPIEKDLPSEINKWLYDITNYEDDEFEIFYYSLGEDSLTIQSTYFFLSKIGTRVRKVVFPTKVEDVIKDADVIITSDERLLAEAEGKYRILVKRNFNKEFHDSFEKCVDELSEVIKDEKTLDEWHSFAENKKQKQ